MDKSRQRRGFPGGTVEKKGNPLQCSCLENSVDRGAWQATVHGVAKSWTQPSTHAHTQVEMREGLRRTL